MVRGTFNLAFGLLLCSGNVLADHPGCSSGEYTSLMKMVGNDASIQQYCQFMPPSHNYDQSKCPQAIKKYSYDKVKSFCGCVKSMCTPTQCGYGKNKCSKTPCGNYCADFQTDNSNCGKCGNQCKYGETCKFGSCKAPCPYGQPDQCPDPNKYGALSCTNKQTDCENCGQCGTKCKSTEKCVGGKCTPNTPTCPSNMPLSCPDGYSTKCVDPKSPDTCGSCANKCTAPKTLCDGGKCRCPTDKPTECGSTCCNPGETCTAGSCMAPVVCTDNNQSCSTDNACCSGFCDLSTQKLKRGIALIGTCKPKPVTPTCPSTETQCGSSCSSPSALQAKLATTEHAKPLAMSIRGNVCKTVIAGNCVVPIINRKRGAAFGTCQSST
ncbi:hypothetical protein DOTSEDRAFT_28920 [Dothistroma septosporum NZE10]|uniref:Uncharacterized protein n=1 Tax=Dothistroma septosporum (strain NZE10 / CBS 128990) TaxID=675120 RepID=M2XGT8_DOTSN|nr:hypothetical protein DOTSEDRAFT_28920 [Dothistroma septosporum NZE10]